MSFLDFKLKNLPADIASGAVSGLVSIPDAIGSAILAGVSPTYGFNALMTGTPIGTLFSGSQFMTIGLTSAMMIAVADALIGYSGEEMIAALFTLTLLIGVFQLAFGLLKLGKFTQFISNSVMVGFLVGIALVVVFGQLGDFTGYYSDAAGDVRLAIDTLLNIGQWSLPTVATGLVTIIIIVIFNRTRLRNFSMAIAMVLGTLGVFLLGLDSVKLVGDTFDIISAFPTPVLPNIALIPELALSAIAIGLIGLIQGAGVSQGVPNPDGEYGDVSQDFSAQGVANLVAGTFQGLPLGGSLGLTGLVKSTGARSRWANVFVGVFVIIFIVLFGEQVELVAMPAVAAVLIMVGIEIIMGSMGKVRDVWDTSTSKRVIMVVTFILTLSLPVQQAILFGVILSFIDYIYSTSKMVQLHVLRPTDTDTYVEESAPEALEDNSITILNARGSAYFAAARTLQGLLPSAQKAQHAVVIMRMRGHQEIGSTLILVMERYAGELRANGGRLMLSGVNETVMDQLQRTETTEVIPEDAIFMATDTLGESTQQALAAAEKWIASTESDSNQTDEVTSEN